MINSQQIELHMKKMSSGERMVWAAEFVRVLPYVDPGEAAISAAKAVTALRMVPGLCLEERYEHMMAQEMLGVE